MRSTTRIATLYRIAPLCVIVLSSYIIAACTTIMDMDRPLPPTYILWERPGTSIKQVDADLDDCGKKTKQEKMSSMVWLNATDLCMLKKGYRFVPQPKGWLNFCALQTFRNTVGCRSARGEIVVIPDEDEKP